MSDLGYRPKHQQYDANGWFVRRDPATANYLYVGRHRWSVTR